MLKDIKVTLYDIFGYFLPGSIALAALYLLWVSFHSQEMLWRSHRIDTWFLMGLVAYYLGHLVQSIGNLFEHCVVGPREVILGTGTKPRHAEWLVGPWWQRIDSQLREDTVAKIKRQLCPKWADDSGGQWLYESCAEILAQWGRGESREIYEYREGFYRGSAISLILLATAMIPAPLCGREVRISQCVSASSGWVSLRSCSRLWLR
jgi:hypothetical protein